MSNPSKKPGRVACAKLAELSPAGVPWVVAAAIETLDRGKVRLGACAPTVRFAKRPAPGASRRQ